jgi:hypothetical protein
MFTILSLGQGVPWYDRKKDGQVVDLIGLAVGGLYDSPTRGKKRTQQHERY